MEQSRNKLTRSSSIGTSSVLISAVKYKRVVMETTSTATLATSECLLTHS